MIVRFLAQVLVGFLTGLPITGLFLIGKYVMGLAQSFKSTVLAFGGFFSNILESFKESVFDIMWHPPAAVAGIDVIRLGKHISAAVTSISAVKERN